MSTRERHYSRWTLPTVLNPPTYRKFVICVPNERFYIAAFQGLLIELTYSKNWQRDPFNTAAAVSRIWQAALASVLCDDCGDTVLLEELEYQMSVCEQLRFFNGKLEGFCCGEWIEIAGQTGIPNGGGSQPGDGTEQPEAGECLSYHAQMPANNKWYLPTIVSTGDVITLSNVEGAGNDGTLAPWHCPNGDTFFAGACIGGTGGPAGGDPLGSANHMEIVMNVAGTWYRPLPGPFTVPGGVTNAQVYFQVNDSAVSDNAGSYTFDVEVCNNETPEFVHVFDFLLTNGGFVNGGAGTGVWVPGAGWKTELTGGNRLLAINSPVTTPYTIISQEWFGNRNAAAGGGTSQSAYDAGSGFIFYGALPTGVGVFDTLFPNTIAGIVQLQAGLDTSGNPGVDNYFTKLIVRGLGADPY